MLDWRGPLKIVLRIAGSILGSPPDPKLTLKYASAVSGLVRAGHSVAVIVGGGPYARNYIASARGMGLAAAGQDVVGLSVSRLNAMLVGMRFGIKRQVPISIPEMMSRLRSANMAVMGGLRPGITTDTVAVLVAERWKADLIIKGSDQEGVYTSDPRKHKDARKLDRITHAKLRSILGTKYVPGMHSIVDPVAVKLLSKSKIRLVVFNGTKPERVGQVVAGRAVGTLVVS